MKVKKSTGALFCCLTLIISLFAFTALPVQAASCNHTLFRTTDGERHSIYYTINGHYERIGTKHQCADCGYIYWTNLYEVKAGEHTWVHTFNYSKNMWDYHCAGCGRYKSDF